MKLIINQAAEILAKSGVILYPTDTVWGIGCNAMDEKAIEKVYSIKNRNQNNPLIILVESERRLQDIVNVPELAWDLIDLSEKPITIIYDNPKNLPKNLLASDSSIGIRLTKDPFCRNLITKINAPLVSTSANISGEPTPKNYNEISPQILEKVDYIAKLKLDESSLYEGSSIIKLTSSNKITIIRE